MRCVIQRMAARDFYDLWYLTEHYEIEADHLMKEFAQKCAAKNLKAASFPAKLDERLQQYKARWKQSLGEQIKPLPDFDQVVRGVQRYIKKLAF